MRTTAALPNPSELVVPAVGNPLAGTQGFLWTFRLCIYGLLLIAVMVGGPIVRVGAVAAMVFAMFADRAGAVRHVLHLAWLPLAVYLAGSVGVPLGGWLATWIDVPTPAAVVIGVVFVVVAGLLVTGGVGRLITRRFRKHRYLYVLNRTLGCLLGVAEGGLLVVVLAWALMVFGPGIYLHSEALKKSQPRLARALGYVHSVREAFARDPANRWLNEANPLPRMPMVMTVAAIGEISAEPGLFWQIVEEGGLEELLEVPVVRKHYETVKADPEIRHAVKKRDLRTLVTSHHFSDALEDDELCEAIAERWPDIRARISTNALEQARRLADRLDGDMRAQYDRAVKRAEQFGIEVP